LILGVFFNPIWSRVSGRPLQLKKTHLHVLFIYQKEQTMSQAKTLTPEELEQVLAYIATRSYALRNRVMLLTGMWSGARVGEIASLKVGDVMNAAGKVKAEIRLTADQTKGRHPRTVFLPQKLRDELQAYLNLRQTKDLAQPLFITAGRNAFSANVMTQHFHWLFKRAGIDGASSHSMRRTFITTLAAKGVGVRVLASLAGHLDYRVTMRYIDASDDMKRNAVEMV
jgi:integrase/recombinase XerD